MPDPTRIAERYEVVRPLGRGTFGHTLLASDIKLGRLVAIKVLHPRNAADLKAYELFDREAAVLRDLRHPGVPAVHTTFRGPWEGQDAAFLVMEFIEGTSLAEVISSRRHLEQEVVLNLFVELLGVLEYLHSRVPPVLHRDIKPANLILRPEGVPVLVDFGAVRNVFRSPDEDGSTIVGTYGYMPYEQYMGQASPSSDLYALGATMLHLVTGRAPPDFMSTAGRLEVPPSFPFGDPFRKVLTKMLAPAQAERYQTAREVRAALMGSAAVPAPARGPGPRTPGSGSRAVALRESFEPVELPPAPRAMDDSMRRLLRRMARSPWELMNTQSRGRSEFGVFDFFVMTFFSVFTAGILPAIFFSLWSSRRRRYRRFLKNGLPAVAQVLDKQDEKIGFEEKLTRVRYEFEADGRRRRGSDQVLPAVAEHWDQGDSIQILYLPDQGFDSVIISTS